MEYRKIFFEGDDPTGGGESEIIDDQKMVTEWTVAMGKKDAAKLLFDSLIDTIKTKIGESDGAAYGGDTKAIITKFNNLVTKFDDEFVAVMNDQDQKLATATDLYKGYQASMDSIFSGGESGPVVKPGQSGAHASTTGFYATEK